MAMSTRKTTPVCDCHGTWHFEGSYGCIHRVTERQLSDKAHHLATEVRVGAQVDASDVAIMHYIGMQAAAVNRSMERRRRIALWILGALCSLAALALAWWEITK